MTAATGNQQVTMTTEQAKEFLKSLYVQRDALVECINAATGRCEELRAHGTSTQKFAVTGADVILFRSILFLISMEKSRLESQHRGMCAQIDHLERAITKAGNMIVPATTVHPAAPANGPVIVPRPITPR